MTPSSLLEHVFLQLYQIWLHYIIPRRRYDQNNLIQYGRRRHVEFTSGSHFDTFSRLGRQNAPAYQISTLTFRIFSRWLPSVVLNFEKFKIWINFRGRSQYLRRHTKFGKNRMIGGRRPRYCNKTEIQYSRRRHVEFTSGLLFDTF